MKQIFVILAYIIWLAAVSFSQSKSNDAISRQIFSLHADKTFTLSYDDASNMSKLMAVAGNFPNAEADRSGISAMNFAAGFFYSGRGIQAPPEQIKVTFWILSKRPRFAQTHDLGIFAGQETFEIGTGRYAARARENMEYLNYEIPRETLVKIARQSAVRITLGEQEFDFTREQLKLFADLILLTDVSATR
ncbi:MAG: hypothetical protein ACR2IH_07185 [Pyrinomonadaceae bacterium]